MVALLPLAEERRIGVKPLSQLEHQTLLPGRGLLHLEPSGVPHPARQPLRLPLFLQPALRLHLLAVLADHRRCLEADREDSQLDFETWTWRANLGDIITLCWKVSIRTDALIRTGSFDVDQKC